MLRIDSFLPDVDRETVLDYPRDRVVSFCKTKDIWGELSNMCAGFSLIVGEVRIPTSEALYQACKFPSLPDAQKAILAQGSPMTAKMKAKSNRAAIRADWLDVNVAVMAWCLRVKLACHKRGFGRILLATKDKPIVEENPRDPFWGAGEVEPGVLRGRNILGRLLMELRDQFRADPDAFDCVRPLDLKDFCLLGEPIGEVRARS